MNTKILNEEKLIKLLNKKAVTNSAIISFCDENDKGIDFNKYPNVKYIKCCIDDLWVDEIVDEKPFKKEFIGIGKFVSNCYEENINEIICQCKHGQSRSSACAAAIEQYFNNKGIDIFANYKYCPNQYFYNGIYSEIKKSIHMKQCQITEQIRAK